MNKVSNKRTALICDESIEVRKNVKNILESLEFKTIEATNGQEVIKFSKSNSLNLIILDTDIKDGDELNVLHKIKNGMNPNVNIILMSDNPKVETAIIGIKLGVLDYMVKPLKKNEIINNINKILDERQIIMDESQGRRVGLGTLIGTSPKMQLLYSKILSVAPTDSSVCIQGESGVGKELVARTIHNLSLRKDGPFVPIECSGITESLFESELFGHIKGAFSGAVKDNIGLFRSGNGGTIFLDEIGEVPLVAQVKLLRALEERKVRPVGSNKTYKIDVRILTATNRNLERALLEGRLRRDFFHRFYVVPMTVVPLREKTEDISLLSEHFLKKFNKETNRKKHITEGALRALCAYDWPGNVRELENVIENICVTSKEDIIRIKNLPPTIPRVSIIVDKKAQKNLIKEALNETGGNKSEAAKLLGITRMTLHRKLKKYEITT